MIFEAEKILIRKLSKEQVKESLDFIWKVFLEFEAVNYPEEDRKEFYKAIHSEEYLDMLNAFGAFDGDTLIGIIAARNQGSHIALFFVEGKYQHQGIGKKLFKKFLEENPNQQITVNSSEYAVCIYEKLGFIRKGELKQKDGLRYIPMIFGKII